MGTHLEARAHYFACKRAHAEAGKRLQTLQAQPLLAKSDREYAELAVEYAERAMIDAHLDWAQAERFELQRSSDSFRAAWAEMVVTGSAAQRARHVVDSLRTACAMARGVAPGGEVGSRHEYAAAFATLVDGLHSRLRDIEKACLRLETLAAHNGAACSKMFDSHLAKLEAAEVEVHP